MVLSWCLEIFRERKRYEDIYKTLSHMFSQSLQQPFEVGNSVLVKEALRGIGSPAQLKLAWEL